MTMYSWIYNRNTVPQSVLGYPNMIGKNSKIAFLGNTNRCRTKLAKLFMHVATAMSIDVLQI
jgi:hypothetical protein